MPQTARDRLEQLREDTEAETLAEVIRNALSLYDTILKETRSGNQLMIQEPDGSLARVIVPQ